MRLVAAIVIGLGVLIAPSALAQSAPSNDNRANAQSISPPQSVTGTTVGATREFTEPGSSCPLPA